MTYKLVLALLLPIIVAIVLALFVNNARAAADDIVTWDFEGSGGSQNCAANIVGDKAANLSDFYSTGPSQHHQECDTRHAASGTKSVLSQCDLSPVIDYRDNWTARANNQDITWGHLNDWGIPVTRSWWIGFSFYVEEWPVDPGSGVSGGILDVHERPDSCDTSGTDQTIHLKLDDQTGYIKLTTSGQNGTAACNTTAIQRNNTNQVTPILVGQWNDIVIKSIYSFGTNNGEVKMWVNGTLHVNYTGINLGFKVDSNPALNDFVKFGLYLSTCQTGNCVVQRREVWHDDLTLATCALADADSVCYDVVNPANFATAPSSSGGFIEGNLNTALTFTKGSWQDLDLGAGVTEGDLACILFDNATSATGVGIGLRPAVISGSHSDARVNNLRPASQVQACTVAGDNGDVEIYGDDTNITAWHAFTIDSPFVTSAQNKTTAAPALSETGITNNTWSTVTLGAAGTRIAAVLECAGTVSGDDWGFRHPDSSSSLFQDGGLHQWFWANMKSNNDLEVYYGNKTNQDCYIIAYMNDGYTQYETTGQEARNDSLTSTGSYVNLTAGVASSGASLYTVIDTGGGAGFEYNIRKEGTTSNNVARSNQAISHYAVALDNSRIAEGQIEDTATDFHLVGSFKLATTIIPNNDAGTSKVNVSTSIIVPATGNDTYTGAGTLRVNAITTPCTFSGCTTSIVDINGLTVGTLCCVKYNNPNKITGVDTFSYNITDGTVTSSSSAQVSVTSENFFYKKRINAFSRYLNSFMGGPIQ